MTKQEYIDDINYLDNRNSAKRSKYRRNLRCYYHTYGLSMTNLDDTSVAGYYSSSASDYRDDTSSGIQENIIKSCIDTLVSKIASQKVRPFFNTINGTFRDMQIVRQAQQFFDQLYDEQGVHKTVASAFRDACVFDTGVIYIVKDNKTISRALPWQISYDTKEASYGQITRLVWKMDNYPVTLLPFKADYDSVRQNVTYCRYYSLVDHKLIHWIPELDYYKEETYDKDIMPFIFINYEDSIKSSSCLSIVDQLWGLQEEIDILLVKIKDASQLASPLKYLVPENSTIKTKKLTNGIGDIITYTALPNQTTPPVVAVTQPFMDPQWQQLLDKFKQDAYELCGISQLSATSQKPKGLNSGIALSTMEDIESDRFETQLDTVINAYKDIARLCISLFDEDSEILPKNRMRLSVTWKDIIEARDQLVIQFSAAENLSKDPTQRAQQVQMLVQMGAVPQSRVTSLMEIPDAVQGYSLANNSINAVMSVIDDCLESGIMEVPDYIPTESLKEEIVNTMLSLKASDNEMNKDDIDKLSQLYSNCLMKEQDSMTSAEMTAVQTLQNELMNDLNNPQGQFAQHVQDIIAASQSNITEEEQQ